MKHDAWFFVGVFAFIFLIWAITGGPTHPIAYSGPSLALPDKLGGGSYLRLPQAFYGVGDATVSLTPPVGSNGGGSLSGSGSNGSVPPSSSLSGVSFGTPSPYRGIVTMSSGVSGAGSSNPNNEYVTLYVSSNAGVPVDISGWTIESEATGNAVVIPQGTSVPRSGIVNAVEDVVLLPGESAYVISGRSPIGASFKENKCTGYYGNFQSFSPSLPLNCPTPVNEFTTYYQGSYIRDDACVNYVNTINRCQVVLSPPVGLSGACQTFLVKYLNYNGCLDAHQSDSDFKGTTWHVYLARTNSMYRTRNEVVKLLDNSGKTVDAFSY